MRKNEKGIKIVDRKKRTEGEMGMEAQRERRDELEEKKRGGRHKSGGIEVKRHNRKKRDERERREEGE